MRYLYAAYRFGLWSEIFDADLPTAAFTEKALDLVGSVALDWVVEAQREDGAGVRPVGLILAHLLPDGRRIEPHIDWFPWATPRNKFEGIAAFIHDASRTYKLQIYIEADKTAFWDRLLKYRMLCKGCKIRDHYSRGEDAMFYYSVGP